MGLARRRFHAIHSNLLTSLAPFAFRAQIRAALIGLAPGGEGLQRGRRRGCSVCRGAALPPLQEPVVQNRQGRPKLGPTSPATRLLASIRGAEVVSSVRAAGCGQWVFDKPLLAFRSNFRLLPRRGEKTLVQKGGTRGSRQRRARRAHGISSGARPKSPDSGGKKRAPLDRAANSDDEDGLGPRPRPSQGAKCRRNLGVFPFGFGSLPGLAVRSA